MIKVKILVFYKILVDNIYLLNFCKIPEFYFTRINKTYIYILDRLRIYIRIITYRRILHRL